MKQYWKIAVALVVIFAAGIGLGYSFGMRNSRSHTWRMRDPGDWQAMMLNRLDQQVTLSPEQREKITPHLRTLGEQIGKIRMEADRENRECFGKFYQEVNPILTEEQRRQLEESRKQLRERGPYFPRGPGGPGGPGPGGPPMGPGPDGKPPRPPMDRPMNPEKKPL